jgi:beta-glucosidase
VEALLASMTLEEKIGQMVQIDISKFMISGTDQVDYDLVKQWVDEYKIGSILNSPFSGGAINGVSGWTASQYREMIINLQKITESTTSKIPIIYGIDSIHGATFVKDAALFPQALAVAATFDTEMAYKSAQVSSRDTRAAGIQWLFAPVLGLGLHPNWARFPETFGEDPYLAAQMGKAIIDGIQYHDASASAAAGDKSQPGRNLRADAGSETEGIPARAAACMKHFIAYSYPVNGHDRSPVLLPDRMVKQLYMPSFQAAIDTGVMTGMESYQEVGGEPMVSSHDYLKNLLRKEMKFEGMLVTDYMEIENLYNWHKVSASQKDAVQLSMSQTTVDMSMVPLDASFGEYLEQLVSEGKISKTRVEDSARRVLQLKEELGMFEERNRHFSAQDSMIGQVGQAEDWQLSLDASRAALTLLKNDAAVLPITNPKANVFVTGPTADSLPSLTGGWSMHWQGPLSNSEVPQGVTILQGIRDNGLFGGEVTYYPGMAVDAQDTSAVDAATVAALAGAADYIVVCVGEGTYAEKPGDIDDLALPQVSFPVLLLCSL